jgi:hypothetical protein
LHIEKVINLMYSLCVVTVFTQYIYHIM